MSDLQQIKLGDLEFQPEDFRIVLEMGLGKEIVFNENGWKHFSDHANRILREKLWKAPEVFGNNRCKETQNFVFEQREKDILKGRLICIEEIGKE